MMGSRRTDERTPERVNDTALRIGIDDSERPSMDVRIKRIYDPISTSDGERVLVDRFWPDGFTDEDGCIDDWVPELAPSTDLRRWFGHDPARFAEFRRRYMSELADKQSLLSQLRQRACTNALTLVYSARHAEFNNAVVLADVLQQHADVTLYSA